MNKTEKQPETPQIREHSVSESTFFSEAELDDFRNGSIRFPFMICDGDKDFNVVEVNEVIALSGMADNKGTPTEMTIYKHVKGKETERLVYRLVQ